MHINDFDYDLPEHFIAQTPIEPRDASRLLVLDKHTGAIEHRIFRDILDLLTPSDLLVLNDTRVIPARLQARKVVTGGAVELLLLRRLNDTDWRALIGGRNVDLGMNLKLDDSDVIAEVIEVLDEGERVLRFTEPVDALVDKLGEMPLPPYIHAPLQDRERYQTVYSRDAGSAAAPTAGLHFTPELLLALRDKGVRFAYVTLHVGLGTFLPMRVENITEHRMHHEWARLLSGDAHLINQTKLQGGRVIAVGTTAARTLETAAVLSAGGDPADAIHAPDACGWRPVIAFEAETNLFIYPGYRWRAVDAMITNFHLPKSSLMMMISSLVGKERLFHAYEVAKAEGYRFFSFGDAMFIR
ncbi:MAG: tRNA preQ1(34) S-adenosylmethionine ribosyltransferase-isomerase QueA [Chloroflexota bacterium]|nr:tRNA preQ1(34) S-adenosylmethionine ribosyltransferase-isomerase QueA [Chloroflexota bacterium]